MVYNSSRDKTITIQAQTVNSSLFRLLSLNFSAFRLVNSIITTKLSWSSWVGIETIHLGRAEHAGNVSTLLNNFPKGFGEGLNLLMGADLGVRRLSLQ